MRIATLLLKTPWMISRNNARMGRVDRNLVGLLVGELAKKKVSPNYVPGMMPFAVTYLHRI